MTPEELAEVEERMNRVYTEEIRQDGLALVAEVRRLRDENERLTRDFITYRNALAVKLDMMDAPEGAPNEAGETEWSRLGLVGQELLRLNGDVCKWREAWNAMNAAADRFCADWKKADAEVARLREALDAAQRIVKRKADREAGREET